MFEERIYLEYLKNLLAIDSTMGGCSRIAAYIAKELEAIGYKAEANRRGDVLTSFGGEGNALDIVAHMDDIGLMVRKVNEDGTLRVCPVGGLFECYIVGDNVRVYTRDGRVYSGTVCRSPGSVHVGTPDFLAELPDFTKNICVVLDEMTDSAAQTRALGIETGDLIAIEPRFMEVNGFLKSRFLDDKACVAVLMAALRELKEKNLPISRKVYAHFTAHEESGLGGAWVPEDTEDVIALDIAPTGPSQTSDEHKVTIIAKGAGANPLNWEVSNELRDCAVQNRINFTVDVFTPGYSTDADAAFASGKNVRHAAFGPGTANSHGYERIHMDAIRETYRLLMAYLTKKTT